MLISIICALVLISGVLGWESCDCGYGGYCYKDMGKVQCECSFSEGFYSKWSSSCNGLVNHCKPDTCANGGTCQKTFGSYYCSCPPNYHGRNCEKTDAVKGVKSFVQGPAVFYKMKGVVERPTDVYIVIKSFGDKFSLKLDDGMGLVRSVPESAFVKTYADRKCQGIANSDRKLDRNICDLLPKGVVFVANVPIDYPIGFRGTHTFQAHSETVGRFDKAVITITNGGSEEFKQEYTLATIFEGPIECNFEVDLEQCSKSYTNAAHYPRNKKVVLRGIFSFLMKWCHYVAKFEYTWSIYKGASTSPYRHNVSTDSKVFIIDKFDLDAGEYTAKLTLKVLASRREGSLSKLRQYINYGRCFFTINYQKLIARIVGGPEVTVTRTRGLTLDASESEDPNFPTKEHLVYVWSCDKEKPFCSSVTTTSPIRTVTDLEADVIYVFKLTVKSNLPGVPADTVEQKVHVIQESRPIVVIKCLRNCLRVHIYEVVSLHVEVVKSVGPQVNFPISYSVNGGSDSDAMSILQPANTPGSYLIKEKTLQLDTVYVFSVKDDQGDVLSSVRLETNDAPTVGSCTFDPSSGKVVETEFNVTCTGFTDKDEDTQQLRYEIFSVKSDTTADSLLAFSYDPFFLNIRLPSGKLKIRATDKFGLYAQVVQEVQLSKMEVNDEVIKGLLKSVDRTITKGDQSQAVQNVLTVLSVVDTFSHQTKLADQLFEKVTELQTYDIEDLAQVSSVTEKLVQRAVAEEKDGLSTKSIKLAGALLESVSGSLLHEINSQDTVTVKEVRTVSMSVLNSIEKVVISRDEDVIDDNADPELHETHMYDVKKGTDDLTKALDNIGESFLSTLVESQEEITQKVNSITMWAKVDRAENLTSLGSILDAGSGGTSLQLGQNFATNFQGQSIGLSVTSMEKNPMWWFKEQSPVNSDVMVVKAKVFQEGRSYELHELQDRISIFMKVNNFSGFTFGGTVELPPVDMSPYEKDNYVGVHKMDVNEGRGLLAITFENINSSLRVLLLEDVHPDFDMVMSQGKIVTSESPKVTQRIQKLDPETFHYLGIIPGPKTAVGEKVTYTINVHLTVCKIWSGESWKVRSCIVGPNSTDDTVHCLCKHLSIFGSSILVPPTIINPILDIYLFLDFVNNPYVVTLVSCFLLLYILLFVWAYRRDKRDLNERGIIVLEDNCPGENYAYLVAVYTGVFIGSGTTANVGIELIGANGVTRSHILGSKTVRVNQRNQDCWYLLYSKTHLGDIEKVHLWHDNTGSSPDWYCEKIIVYDIHTGVGKTFMVRQWISIINEEDRLEIYVYPATDEEINSWTMLTKENLMLGFRETHLWISVFTRHPRSAYTRCQRLTVATCMITSAMLASLMFYGVAKSVYADDPSYSLGIRELVVSIESLLITIPVAFILVFCFKKSRPIYDLSPDDVPEIKKPEEKKEKVPFMTRLKMCCHSCGEICSNTESIKIFMEQKVELRPLLPASLGEAKKQENVKRVWFFMAWGLAISIIIITSFFLMLYGLKAGANKSLLWLSAILMRLAHGIFFIQPMKIFVIALLLGLIFRSQPKTTLFTVKSAKGIDPKLKKDKKYMKNLLSVRFERMYAPLTPEEVRDQRARRVVIEARKRLLFGLVIIVFFFVLIGLSHRLGVSEINRNVIHLKEMMSSSGLSNGTSFDQIYNKRKFLEYVKTTLIPSVHKYEWYNGKSLYTQDANQNKTGEKKSNATIKDSVDVLTGWAADYVSRLIGSFRIRQLRVRNGTCNVPPVFNKSFESCNSSLTVFTEDIHSYDSEWKNPRKKYFGPDTIWSYSTPWKTETMGVFGETALFYSGGGYTEDLGRTSADSLKKLIKLLMEGWFDELTRVIFVEFNLFNVNTKLFSAVTLITEHLPSGIYVPKLKVQAAPLMFQYVDHDVLFTVFGVIFLLLLLVIIVYTVRQVSRFGMINVLSSWSSFNECFIIMSATFIVITYIVRLTYFSVYVNMFEASEDIAFTSFYFPLFHNFVLHKAVGFTLILSGFYILFLLSFETNSVFALTLRLSLNIITIVLIFCIITLGLISGVAFINGSPLFKLMSSIMMNPHSYRIIQEHLLFKKDNGFALFYSFYCLFIQIIVVAVLIYYYEIAEESSRDLEYRDNMLKRLFVKLKRVFWKKKSKLGSKRSEEEHELREFELSHIKMNVMTLLTLDLLGHRRGVESRKEAIAGLTLLMLTDHLHKRDKIEITQDGTTSFAEISETRMYRSLYEHMNQIEAKLNQTLEISEHYHNNLDKILNYLHSRR